MWPHMFRLSYLLMEHYRRDNQTKEETNCERSESNTIIKGKRFFFLSIEWCSN
jgi:hypothetical protein